MHSKIAPDRIFPSINNPGDEENGYSAHQLPEESLARMVSFADTRNVAYDAFLGGIWAMVLRQYIGSDDVCFDNWKMREDGPGEQEPGLPRHQMEASVCQASIVPQDTVEEFWNRSKALTHVEEDKPGAKCNTGIIVWEGKASADPGAIFEEVQKQQGTESLGIQVLLVLETTLKVPQQLCLLSKTSTLSGDQARHVAWTVSHAITEVTNGLARQIGDLSFLSAEDRGLILGWNEKTFRNASPTLLIPEAIHKHSKRQPNAVAVSSWDGELTFAELEAHASRLAVFLRHAGVKPRALVPIIFEKSRWAIVSQLAILKAGAAFVPLEPSDPDNRLQLIIRKVQATVLVTSEKHERRCTPWARVGISVSSRFMASLPYSQDTVSLPPIDRLALAYVLFTSGSTGEPKGVLIDHEAMSQLCWQNAYVGIEASSRVLQFSAYSFAMAIIEIYMALAAGAAVCTPSDHDRVNRPHEAIEEMKITWAVFTPSVLRNLDANNPPSRLKRVITGGEPLGKVEFQSWFGKVEFLNGYGMSENAGIAALARLTSIEADLKTYPPSPTTRRWLVHPDDHDQLVPIGAVGELLLEGPGLTKGYLDNPDATAQAFIDCPPWRISMEDTLGKCSRLYKAGDLFRLTTEGDIQYIGRKSTQLKIRGKRVDVSEVEAVLREYCEEGMHIVVEGSAPLGEVNTTTLVAFICPPATLANGSSPLSTSPVGEPSVRFRSDVSIIRSKISTRLPEHMQPTLYIPLVYVPHTVTGKVARRVLREIVQQRSRDELEAYQSAPIKLITASTGTEKMVHDLFVLVLGLDGSRFGIHHDFIKLGGDSLGAMRLVNLLRSRGYTVTVAEIMQLRTIAEIADLLGDPTRNHIDGSLTNDVSHGVEDLGDANIKPPSPFLKQAIVASGVKSEDDVQEVLPCSPIQQGLLLSHARNPELYRNRVVWEVNSGASSDTPDIDQLRATWRMLCVRHPILRTIFVESSTTGGLAVQVVLKPTCPGVWSATFGTSKVVPLGHAQPLYHSNTGMSWLPRMQVIQGPEGKLYCVLDIHHALMDAFSMNIIERDFCDFYKIHQEEHQETTNGVFNDRKWYGDYIQLLPSTTPDTHLSFWKSELMGMEPCLFPQLAGQKEQESLPKLQLVHVDLGPNDAQRLRSFCMEMGVTAANVFMLAWALVLKAYTGSSSVCFGYMTAGRDLPLDGIEDIVGPFIQTLPCYLQLDPREALDNTINRLQADLLRALPHQQASYADIQHAIGLGGQALFNTAVTFLPTPAPNQETTSIMLRRIAMENPTEYELVLEVEPAVSGFECNIRYWSNFISKDKALHIAGVMRRALTQIVNRAHLSIGRMELLCDQDKKQIKEWNRNTPTPSNTLLHDLIQQRCQWQPDALAVQAWGGTLTYRELDQLSSFLAVELQDSGVAPDSADERGAELGLPSIVVSNRLCEIQESRELLPVHVNPSHALYAVFTSGSTGKPKGVVLEHRCFCPTALTCPEALDLRPQDRTMHFCSYAFDISLIEIAVPLVVGACICIPSEEDRLNRLQHAMRNFRVSWAIITPTVARLLQPKHLPNMRTLVVAGEAVLESDFETWSPWTNFISAYSPAECTPVGLATAVGRASPNNLGWGFGSHTPWIVNPQEHQRLAPVGAIGELLIEGPVVGRGYLHDLSCSLPNSPFIAAPGWLQEFRPDLPYRRLYRTGDLVQYDENGAVRFVGRKDTQVKVRGQRLEPGEVEYNIGVLLPWAKTVIVEPVLLDSKNANAVVVAFISKEEPDSGQGPSMAPELGLRDETFFKQVATVASKLRDRLPTWMIPTIFLPLAQIPLTKSGKVDRRRLGELVVSMPREELEGIQAGPREEPATEMERLLQGLFSRVIQRQVDRIWADSDFFIMGGDSVSAMRLVSAGTELGLDLTVAKIFKHPILRDLAAAASISDLRADRDQPIPPFSLIPAADKDKILQLAAQQCYISVDEIEDVYPSTPLQEALMAATARDPDMYTARFIYDVADGVDLERLQTAWQATVDRNAILRTRLVEALPYGAFQVVLQDSRTQIEWLQYQSTKGYEDFEAAAPAMDLGMPLLRFALINEAGCPERIAVIMHHAIYDGAALQLMLKEVDSAYNSQLLQLAPFNKFVRYLEEQESSSATNFWRTRFAGVEAPIFPQIPSTINVPKATEYLEFETTIRAGWKQFGVTLATSIRLAWAILVSYYTDSKVVVFGDTVTGRALPIDNIDNIFGPTIATVPFLVHVNGDQSVQEALSAVQAQATQMVQYEATGLQHIRRASPEAAAACDFQTQLVIESPEANSPKSSTMVSPRHPSITAAFSSYALALVCTPSRMSDKMKIEAQFDSDVMNPEATSRLLVQFGHVLGQICSGYDQLIRDVQVNSPSDIRLLRQWNQTVPNPYEYTMHELVLQSALTSPTKLAIESWDGQLTYAELDEASALVGQAVMGAGVCPGDRVALSFARSKWAVIAMLGILRAGAACVNIDPALPSGRVCQILDLAKPALFLASPEVAPEIQQNLAVPTLSVPSTAQPKESLPWPATRPEDVSFIIFTSGSTGVPKGIVLEHVNLASGIHYHSHSMGAHPDMRSLQFGSYAFDIIIAEVFTTWVQGGCVCIPSDTDRLSNLAGFMEKYRVNWAIMTPSTVSVLHPEDVPMLETLVLGGEPVPTDLVHIWGPNVQLINAYGPAETSVSCAGGPLIWGEASPGLIGSMVGSVGWIVVPGDSERLAPIGAVGELLIEGPLVARGYYQEPEKTRQAFLDPPLWLQTWRAGSSPGRLFLSGDLVRYNGNGRLEYVGRKDTQVKLRGQRVELIEVARHIRAAFPEIKSAVVDVIRRGPGSHNPDLLVAFVHFNSAAYEDKTMGLFQDKRTVSIAHIAGRLERLERALPAYMVPGIMASVRYMPYTTSGKIDRRTLRESAESLEPLELQSLNLLADRRTVEEPQNEVEIKWRQLWSQVLSVAPETLGRDDDFFRIGSDSIGAMKLSSLARREGLEITVADIFKYPRLKDMAAAGRATHITTSTIDPFTLIPDGIPVDVLIEQASIICQVPVEAIVDIYPATPIQAGLLAITSQEAGAYVALYSYDLPTDIDIQRLHVAWNRTAEAHPILRTRFIQSGAGATYQVVINEPLSWHQHEQGHVNPNQLCYSTTMGSPLLHLIYAPCGVQSYEVARLFVSIHHALYDGWSWPLLLQEVERAYQGADLEYTAFAPFVQHVQSSMEDAAIFWQSKMKKADPVPFPSLPIPSYRPQPASTMSTTVSLSPSKLPGHVTLATKCKLGWALLTSCYRNNSDVVYGIISSGRGAPVAGIERMIGPTMATTPLRFQLDPTQNVQKVLHDMQRDSWELSTFEHFGIQNIRQQGDGARVACKFQTQLVIQPEEPEFPVSWFQSQRTLSSVQQFSDCALTLTCIPSRGSLEVSAVFDSNVLSLDQVQRVIWEFEHTLAQLETASQNTTIGDLDMLNPRDWKHLKTMSPHLAPFDGGLCAHEAIKQVCLEQRQAIAVDAWDGQWTYEELEIRATYLASRLSRHGVSRNRFVALYFSKSRWTVIAQLAVLKAGGAIEMLDPSHPPHRLRTICDMIEPACILAHDKKQPMEIAGDIPIVGLEDILNVTEVSTDYMPSESRATLTDAMFSIATSGTTGIPKIMVIEHGAFMASAQSFVPRLGLDHTSRVIQFTGYSFDAVYIDHLGTLLAGGCICIPSPSDRDNRLAQVMTEMRVNWAILTTSVIQILSPSTVPTLQMLVQAGEPMSQSIVDTWAPHVRLLNAYGPSECTIISTIKDAFSTSTSPGNVGYSSGCVCWITDPENIEKLVPIGAEGELLIEGPILARGYLKDPERTAKAFVQRPKWLRTIRQGQQCYEDRVYRTGDIVKYGSSGEIIYLSRKGSQVKLRGQRIELSGIENHVHECFPDAIQVIVEVATLPGSSTETLIAFVFTSQSRRAFEKQKSQSILSPVTQAFMDGVRAAELKLQEQVPAYMIPSLFLSLTRIPWNSNGKVDRPVLRQLASGLSRDELNQYTPVQDYIPPTTEMERAIQAVWARVLSINPDRIGIRDSFFRLGGDSVTSMQAASQFQSDSIPVTVKDIFQHRTIVSLAAHAEEMSRSTVAEHIQRKANGVEHKAEEMPSLSKEPVSLDTIHRTKGYWGDVLSNTYGDAYAQTIALDKNFASLLLGDANQAYRTQTAEIIQAAILHAFVQVFPDRPAPLIFVTGDGRQLEGNSSDLARNVGFFTSIRPVPVSLEAGANIQDAVKLTRDACRRPDRDDSRTRDHGPMEILLNLNSQTNELRSTDPLIPIEQSHSVPANTVHDKPRFALLEIYILALHGRLEMQFYINRHMNRQSHLRDWVQQCELSLKEAATALAKLSPVYTISDFPLASLTPKSLDHLMTQVIPRCVGDIQDIYPCSPIQQGMLISQTRKSSFYDTTYRWKVVPTEGSKAVSVEGVSRAWQAVVDRHDILRTAFVSISNEGYSEQLVLKHVEARIQVRRFGQSVTSTKSSAAIEPPHRLDILHYEDGGVLLEAHIHHALVDAVSIETIKRDFVLAYDGHLPRSMAPSYRDYIEYLQTDSSHQNSQGFWSGYLNDATPCLFPRLSDTTDSPSNPDVDHVVLDLMSVDLVDCFCEIHGLSLTSVIHVAWAIVINRFTASHDACFGYLSMGRHIPLRDVQNMVGPLINMLIGRVHLQPDASVLSVLQACHAESLDSLSHQHDSLAEIYHSMGLSAGELFNTVISIQRQRGEGTLESPHSTITLENDGGIGQTEYPVVLEIIVNGGEMSLSLSYQTSFLTSEQADTVARTFRKVVSEIMRDPSQLTVNDVEALDDASKRRMLERNLAWQIPQPEMAPIAIHHMCLKQPHRPAVAAWDGEFTYGELDRLSSALADEIISRGSQRNQIIPLYFDKSCWTVVAMLATWKAGSAFILLDATHPPARHHIICEEVNASMIVSSDTNRSKAADLIPNVIETGPAWAERTEFKPAWTPMEVRPNDAAYVMFTSGSTGRPKGVVLEHESLAIVAASTSPSMGLDSTSRVLQFAAHAWDATMMEIVFTLLVGGCICVPSAAQRLGSVTAAANDLRVTWAFLTPTVARTLRSDEIRYLRTLVIGGEPLSTRDILDWHDSVDLIQIYGVTECTILSSITASLTPSSNVRNVGRPYGVHAWIVDRDNHDVLVPDGAVGEVVLEGQAVGRGYINRPDLYNTAFIQPPAWFSSLRGEVQTRLYKTGDLARYASDGSLIYIGRKDSQVKLRGQRFELGEVEHLVQAAFPSAVQAIAEIINVSENNSSPELVAFIYQKGQVEEPEPLLCGASQSFRKDITTAVSTLQSSTPVFMIPTSFFPLVDVPRADSGKVDRNKLRQHVSSLSQAEREAYSVALASRRTPRTAMEARLQRHVAQVLKTSPDKIPLDHDLFQAGLNSVTAVHLVALARKDGLDLPIPTVFQFPRLVDMAPLVTEQTKHQVHKSSQLSNTPEVDIEALCRIWNLDRKRVAHVAPTSYFQRKSLEGDMPDYRALHLSGPIDRSRLRGAVESVLEKHSILRTIFVPFQDTIMNVVLSGVDLPFEEIMTDQDPRSVSGAICAEDSPTSTAFNYMHFKVIFITADDRMTMVIRFHHAQYDGFCLPYLFQEIVCAYEGPLAEAEVDFPHYLTERLIHGRSPTALQFWRDTLQGSSMTYILKNNRTGPSQPESSIVETITSHRDCRLPTPTTPSPFSMATITKAAWALCLAEQTNSIDLVFGQIVTGRTLPLPGIDQIIGACVSIIPVRVPVQSGWKIRDLLQFIHDQNAVSMAHDTVDLDTLITECTDWASTTTLGSVVQFENSDPRRGYPFLGGVDCEMEAYQFNPPSGYPHLSCHTREDGMLGMEFLVPGDHFDQDGADRILCSVAEVVDPYQLRNLLTSTLSLDLPGIKGHFAGFPISKLIARLDSLLFVLKSCKEYTCRKPWEALHPEDGGVEILEDAMNPEFDYFYEAEQQRV
ncbi:hypothetical protein BDV19DRAFT_385559 [Aspergillus venezuelensis]